MWTAILAAGAAILGSITAGVFNLAIQRGSRSADTDRWTRELDARRHDRLYDQRLQTYTEFLNESSNALGYESCRVLEKYKQVNLPDNKPLTVTSPHIEILARAETFHPSEFSQFSFMKMSRARRAVEMLTESTAVKSSVATLWTLLIEMISLKSDDPEINEKFFAIYSNHGDTTDQFTRAAHAELTR